MDEPSLLDFIKAKLMPWKYSISDEFIHQNEGLVTLQSEENHGEILEGKKEKTNWFYSSRLILALIFVIIGQSFLEPPDRQNNLAIFFYSIGVIFLLWNTLSSKDSLLYKNRTKESSLKINLTDKQINWLLASMIFLVLAFFAFRKTQSNEIFFNGVNITLWATSFILFLFALLDIKGLRDKISNTKHFFERKQISIKISPWTLLLFISTLLVFFFRFSQLNQILGEMFSDHAEKLLDVYDVLSGKFPVFFIRNTGRELFQFYWTALIAIIFKTGISFMSLKLGTALAGFLTLPFIYLLGKELRNKWVGIFAFLLAGIAYWPNVISRVGLRFPFYPLFTAPTLFFLIRGIRQKRPNDFIYSGIALGIGLHGYSSTRFLPIVVVLAIVLFLIHKRSKGLRNQTMNAFIMLVIASFIIFLPLFKFSIVNPEAFSYRMMTRLTSSEREITENPLAIFIDNYWKANTMFFYSNGGAWVHSIPNRPALDIVSAALYFLGTMIVLLQYLKYRNWEDIFLLLAVPLLMMPSILAIAFPEENPSLNRTGGAYIPVFIIAGIGFYHIFHQLWQVARHWKIKTIISVVSLVFFLISCILNYDLVFNQFNKQFMAGAWNTSQMGKVIKGFSESIGNPDRAYVVPSAHWVDTRLVGINAGYPTKDYALWPDQFDQLIMDQGEKLIILKPDNIDALTKLKELFPNGILYIYYSGYDGKDFYIYHIPPIVINTQTKVAP